MSNLNLQERLSAEEWNATPPAVQALLQTLLPVADEVAELRERVALLENNRSPVPVADENTPELHPYVKIFGSLSGPVWDEIFEEMECERQQEIAAEAAAEAAEAVKAA